jgi:hypothetical protein
LSRWLASRAKDNKKKKGHAMRKQPKKKAEAK